MEEWEVRRFLREILAEFYDEGLPPYIERDLPWVGFKKIRKVVTVVGPRRVGKTHYLYQLMGGWLKRGKALEDMIYINFEDERLWGMEGHHLRLILEVYEEMHPNRGKPLLFLDEIHTVPQWERFVNRLVERGHHVYVTGSNAKLLSKEVASTLRGRAYSVEVGPLTFREFLRFRGIEGKTEGRGSGRTRKAFEEYLSLSGYPEVVLEERIELLDDYLQATLYKDVVERYGVRNHALLHFLIHYIIRTYARPFSIHKVAKVARSAGFKASTSLIHRYVKMLEEAYFLYLLKAKKAGKKGLVYEKKAYVVDHGLPNRFTPEKEWGRLLEQVAYHHLRRRYGERLWYGKNGFECDFITPEGPIQVTYEIGDNKERELQCFERMGKGLLLTMESEGEIKTGKGSVRMIPLWKWALRG